MVFLMLGKILWLPFAGEDPPKVTHGRGYIQALEGHHLEGMGTGVVDSQGGDGREGERV